MAASNVIFNLSRSSFPQSQASRSPGHSVKTSNVCLFTSSSNFSKVGNAGQKSRYSSSRRAYDDKDWSTKAKQTLDEDIESGKQSFEELKGAATEYAKDTAENLKGAAASIGEKAKEGSDKVVESAESVKEKVQGYADDATQKTKDAAETIAAKAKEDTNKAVESAESAKDKTFNAAESGAETVKDKVNEGTSQTAEAVKNLKL
ncbi:desiccation-related protein PCC3-06-like [Argentina anserina]|uniref:desiccation-related protein PCC3-06-like n=1 Tax=Argentina anserina TaxID=57926 RepID=UPI0021766FE7|nr:desiccation-related protein PCC3-06-like [Potentilla anserina]